MVWVKPVDEAPIGLYTKLRKTRIFEMDVIQKLHIGKLPNLAHNGHMVVCTNITIHGQLQIKQYCFIQGVLICKNMIIISRIDPQIRWGCYIIPFNDIKNSEFYFLYNFTPSLTWFTTLQKWYLQNTFFKQFVITVHV